MTDMEDRERRRCVFGAAADAYDTARPGYPERLIDDVVAFANLEGAPALEVGAGTGKATVAFAERGVSLTCLEPDARMAEVLARKVAGNDRVSVVVSGLEDYDGLNEQFGLLIAAQSWHWIDPAKRWDLAVRALRPGGALALFWNANVVPEGALHAALLAAHEQHGAEQAADDTLGAVPPADYDASRMPPSKAVSADGRFTDIAFPVYQATHTFSTQRYVDYLESLSSYRVLAEDQRSALLSDVRRIVDAHGGSFEMASGAVAILARKR